MPFLEVVRTALLPLGVTAVVVLVSLRLGERGRVVGGALGVMAAFLGAHYWITGWPGVPPIDATNSALLLAPLGLLALLPSTTAKWWWAVLPWLVVGILTAWLVMKPLAGYYEWTAVSGTLWGALAVVGLVLLTRPVRGEVDRAVPAVLGIVATGAGVAAIAAHSAKLSQLSLALGVSLATVSALLFLRPAWSPVARGAAAIGAVALAPLILSIHLYADLGRWPTALLLAAWASLELLPLVGRRLGARISLVVHTLLAAMVAGAAVWVAFVEKAAAGANAYY